MTLRLAVITFLACAPSFAAAQACGPSGDTGCPTGMIWSPLTQSCEPLTMV